MGMALSIPRFTMADLEQFPDDGNRYELLDGMLIVTPAPKPRHEIVASRIAGQFMIALQAPGYAMVFTAGAISAPPSTQLEPDVLIVPARFVGATEWTEMTEHWLAIEVFSRSSRVYDRRYKRDAYLDLGVREVWLVDPVEKYVEVTRARGDVRTYTDVVEWRDRIAPVGVTIDLRDLFQGLS